MTYSSFAAVVGIPIAVCAWSASRAALGNEPVSAVFPAAAGSEVVEEVDTIEDVTVAQGGDLTVVQIIGRTHPAAVHLPIGWIVLLTLWELGMVWLRRQDLERVGMLLGVAAVLSFAPAIVTGLLRAEQLAHDPAVGHAIGEHRNIMLAAAALLLGAVVMRVRHRQQPLVGGKRVAYLGLLVVASALVAVGGHWGGKLVFGESYLPF